MKGLSQRQMTILGVCMLLLIFGLYFAQFQNKKILMLNLMIQIMKCLNNVQLH